MSKSSVHPLLAFAERYSDPTQQYFDAYTALARLEQLQEDLTDLTGLLEAKYPPERRWFPWLGSEAVSYYAVGFVTCLEWHARSRLNDLLKFSPDSIKIDDVRGTISDKLIVQMAAKNASVAQLVSGAVRVGGFERYLAIFARVFEALQIETTPMDWLLGDAQDSTICWISRHDLPVIDRLFAFRHELVHEIGSAVVGHPNIRDALSPVEAAQIGRICWAVIAELEQAITASAPKLFPNLLTADRYPVSLTSQLEEELDRLTQIASIAIDRQDWDFKQTRTTWVEARDKFTEYMAAEDTFIERAAMLHWRYFDARTPLKARLRTYRIGFLAELLSHFHTEEIDNPNLHDEDN